MRRWLSYAALLAISLGGILLADFTTSHLETSSGADPTPTPPARTPAPTAERGPVARRLDAVQRACNAGQVQRLCRPGRLLDADMLAHLHRPGVADCEAGVEQLLARVGEMNVTVIRGIRRLPGGHRQSIAMGGRSWSTWCAASDAGC